MIQDLTVTSLETITAFNHISGAYLFTLDELQNATIGQGEEKTDITGRAGRKITSLKRNKTFTVEATNGMLSAGLLSLQTGTDWETKATIVRHTDYLTVSDNEAATSWKAVGTAGAEIIDLVVKNADGTLSLDTLEQDSTAAAGKYAYDPATKKLSFSGIEDGTEIMVYYDRRINADVLDGDGSKYSGKATLYIDFIAEDKCGKSYHGQFFVPKADISGEFSIEMGDNQTVHAFNAEALAGACGLSGDNLWTFTIFGSDAEDVE